MMLLPARRVFEHLMQKPKQWHVLSVCRKAELPMVALAKSHCHLDCDDVREAELSEFARDARHVTECIPPTHSFIERALRYARNVGTEGLIVHCQAGLSRSPAIAWCVLMDQLRDPHRASAELFRIRPEAEPSRLIIRLGLELLGVKHLTAHQALAEYERLADARFGDPAP